MVAVDFTPALCYQDLKSIRRRSSRIDVTCCPDRCGAKAQLDDRIDVGRMHLELSRGRALDVQRSRWEICHPGLEAQELKPVVWRYATHNVLTYGE